MNRFLTVFLVALIYSFLVWWPSRYLPYFWDSSGYLINTARDFLVAQPPLFISHHTDFAHPPLFPLLLSLAWRFFGNTQLTSHLLMFPFLPLLLISVYYLAKKFLPPTYALFATGLIGLHPTVLAEYINVYVDLPSAAIITAGLCALVYRRWLVSIILLSLAILIKIPILTLIPVYFLILPKPKRFYLLIPLLCISIWLFYHYQVTGWLFSAPTRSISYPGTISQFISSFLTLFVELFISQTKFVWTGILILAGLVYKFKPTKITFPHQAYLYALLAGLLAAAVFFIATAEIAPRYLLFILPIMAVFVAAGLAYLLAFLPPKPYLHLIIIGLPLMLLVSQWRPSSKPTAVYDFLAPYNLHIYDYIQSFRLLAATLEANSTPAEIYGGFPENQMLTQPYQGYVSNPQDFYPCSQFVFRPAVRQMVIAHPYSPNQIDCAKLINLYAVTPTARFDTNGIWVELYQINASQSAQIN